MQVVVIINPVAGAAQRRAAVRQMLVRLGQAGHQVITRITRAAGDARHMARQAADSAHAVVVVGGDGTVGEAAAGLIGTSVPLIIWPRGTENLVAKAFGFQSNPDYILACLHSGTHKSLDVGIANDRPFLLLAGIGFDAEVVHRLKQLRIGHITHLSYGAPLWRTFWEHRFPPLRVSSAGRHLWEGRGLVFVANLPQYALNLNVVRDARGDDGLLDLCILPCDGRIGLLGHALRTLVRKQIEHPSVVYQRLPAVRVEAAVPVSAQLDGDEAGTLPLDIRILPAALVVRIPPASIKG